MSKKNLKCMMITNGYKEIPMWRQVIILWSYNNNNNIICKRVCMHKMRKKSQQTYIYYTECNKNAFAHFI